MSRKANAKRIMLGAGGHARVLLDEMRRGGWLCDGIIDPGQPIHTKISGVPVIGNQESKTELQGARLINGVGMLPGKPARLLLARKIMQEGWKIEQIISHSSSVSSTATLGPGAQVLAGAVVNSDALVGRDVVINTSSVVEHDVSIGDRTWISPGAIICGGVDIGEDVFVGAGAIVLQGVKIGARAVIGAGTVITKPVKSSEKVVSDVGCVRTVVA